MHLCKVPHFALGWASWSCTPPERPRNLSLSPGAVQGRKDAGWRTAKLFVLYSFDASKPQRCALRRVVRLSSFRLFRCVKPGERNRLYDPSALHEAQECAKRLGVRRLDTAFSLRVIPDQWFGERLTWLAGRHRFRDQKAASSRRTPRCLRHDHFHGSEASAFIRLKTKKCRFLA